MRADEIFPLIRLKVSWLGFTSWFYLLRICTGEKVANARFWLIYVKEGGRERRLQCRHAGDRDVTGVIHEWRRLSERFADINGKACAAAEEAKAAMQEEAEPGIPYSPLTVAKFPGLLIC
jgi:hypothetical protein